MKPELYMLKCYGTCKHCGSKFGNETAMRDHSCKEKDCYDRGFRDGCRYTRFDLALELIRSNAHATCNKDDFESVADCIHSLASIISGERID